MEILFCQWGGLGEQAIERTFCRLGYQVKTCNVKSNNYDYDKELLELFTEEMKDNNFDCVFSINFLPIISKVCNVFRTKYICWVYDCPEMHLYSKALANSVNRVFIFDRIQYNRFVSVAPANIFYMPLATNPMSLEELNNMPVSEQRKYTCDISFIGSLYNERDKRFHEIEKLPDYWKGYIQGIVEAQLNVFGYNFIADSLSHKAVEEMRDILKYELIDDYCINDREVIADTYIGTMASALERKRTIEALSKICKVTLYTDSETKGLVNIENRGLADSLTMMPQIFHCSKININITSKTIQSGIPLRVFDILGAGGFLITNYQVEIGELFEPGEDLIVYEDLRDLEIKVDYYLHHDKERVQIAKSGYRKVCSKYTYDIVISRIMKLAGVEC